MRKKSRTLTWLSVGTFKDRSLQHNISPSKSVLSWLKTIQQSLLLQVDALIHLHRPNSFLSVWIFENDLVVWQILTSGVRVRIMAKLQEKKCRLLETIYIHTNIHDTTYDMTVKQMSASLFPKASDSGHPLKSFRPKMGPAAFPVWSMWFGNSRGVWTAGVCIEKVIAFKTEMY